MRGQPLDIVEAQSVAREYLFDGMHRKIRKMLVIDGIEFDMFYQLQNMRKFHGDVAVWTQQQGNAGDEIVELGHVRQHIVTNDEICLTSLAHQVAGELLAEKLHQRRN